MIKNEEILFLNIIDKVNELDLNKSGIRELFKSLIKEINEQTDLNNEDYQFKYQNYFHVIDFIIEKEFKDKSKKNLFNLFKKGIDNDIKYSFYENSFISKLNLDNLFENVKSYNEFHYLINEFETKYKLNIFSTKYNNYNIDFSNGYHELVLYKPIITNYLVSEMFDVESFDFIFSNNPTDSKKGYYKFILDNLFLSPINENRNNEIFNLLMNKYNNIFLEYLIDLETSYKNSYIEYREESSISKLTDFLQTYKIENLYKLNEIIKLMEKNNESYENIFIQILSTITTKTISDINYIDSFINCFDFDKMNLNLNNTLFINDFDNKKFAEYIESNIGSYLYISFFLRYDYPLSMNLINVFENKFKNENFDLKGYYKIYNEDITINLHSFVDKFISEHVKNNFKNIDKENLNKYIFKTMELLDNDNTRFQKIFDVSELSNYINRIKEIKNNIILNNKSDTESLKNIKYIEDFIFNVNENVLKIGKSVNKNKNKIKNI